MNVFNLPSLNVFLSIYILPDYSLRLILKLLINVGRHPFDVRTGVKYVERYPVGSFSIGGSMALTVWQGLPALG